VVLKLSVARLEVLVWVLIYAGLLTFALGLALGHFDGALGRVMLPLGIVSIGVGALLIWIRARMVGQPAKKIAAAAVDSSTPSESP
jgi:hypothetical protein